MYFEIKINMKRIAFLSIAALSILFTSCSEPTASVAPAFSLDSVKAAIAASNKMYGESLAKNDSATFIGSYTADAVLMPPNMPAMSGSAGIAAFFRASYNMGMRGLEITTTELIGGADGVSEIGTFALKDGAGNTLDKGKFIVVWKNDNGTWKMHRDIFNSDAPAPPPAPIGHE
jgi:ketosteroid isomerase-like protein